MQHLYFEFSARIWRMDEFYKNFFVRAWHFAGRALSTSIEPVPIRPGARMAGLFGKRQLPPAQPCPASDRGLPDPPGFLLKAGTHRHLCGWPTPSLPGTDYARPGSD